MLRRYSFKRFKFGTQCFVPPHQACDASLQQANVEWTSYAGCASAHSYTKRSPFRIETYKIVEPMSLIRS